MYKNDGKDTFVLLDNKWVKFDLDHGKRTLASVKYVAGSMYYTLK